jgi:hypothetical protein
VRVAKLGGISPTGDVKMRLVHMAVTGRMPVVREQLALITVFYLIDPSGWRSTPGSIVVLDEGIPVTYCEL